jgi:hypothetical protein
LTWISMRHLMQPSSEAIVKTVRNKRLRERV